MNFASCANANNGYKHLILFFISENVIVCQCSENAILLTVRKEGPNTGRQFYKCSKPQGTGCDFFLWADASTSNSSAAGPHPTFNAPGDRGMTFRQPIVPRQQHDDNSETSCECGEPAKQLTVQKEGPNQGRQFFACAKPREAQCNFFQWSDEAGTSGGGGFPQNSRERFGGGSRGRGRGRGQGKGRGRAESSSNESKKRKCSNCGQEGK